MDEKLRVFGGTEPIGYDFNAILIPGQTGKKILFAAYPWFVDRVLPRGALKMKNSFVFRLRRAGRNFISQKKGHQLILAVVNE